MRNSANFNQSCMPSGYGVNIMKSSNLQKPNVFFFNSTFILILISAFTFLASSSMLFAVNHSNEPMNPIDDTLRNLKSSSKDIQSKKVSDADTADTESYPDPGDFVPVEKEPTLDYAKFSTLLKYPQTDAEGRIIVRVLINSKGVVKKTLIEYTDSDLFNKPVIEAIKGEGLFTPAMQNGKPINCWVSVPVTFKKQ